MTCHDLLHTLSQYIDGTLDPALCDQFQRHVAHCNPCRIVVDTVRKTIQLYKGDEPFQLPFEFRTCLHQTLRNHWKPNPS